MIIVKIYLGISLALLWAVGSVQGQIAPCSSLYFFSRSTGAPQMCSPSIYFRVLVCWPCPLPGVSPFFVYFGFFFHKSLQGISSALVVGDEGGHLFSLTCLVVLWRGRDIANKYLQHVWRVLAVEGPHLVCHRPRRHVLSSPHCSGSRVLCKGTVPSGPCVSYTFRV